MIALLWKKNEHSPFTLVHRLDLDDATQWEIVSKFRNGIDLTTLGEEIDDNTVFPILGEPLYDYSKYDMEGWTNMNVSTGVSMHLWLGDISSL